MNHEALIMNPISDLCSDLNTQREKRSYNRDDCKMIYITKLDCFQQIHKQDHI